MIIITMVFTIESLFMMDIKIILFTKRIIIWISQGKYFWGFLFLFCMIFILDKINIGLNSEENIRIYGLILQLIGMTTIVYSLKDKLILFKGYTLSHFYINYFRSFSLKTNHKNVDIKAESNSSSTLKGKARIVIKPKEDFKDIVRYLDEEIEYVNKRLIEIKNENQNEITELKKDINILRLSLNRKIKETNVLISDSSVSNVWLESFGIINIIIGLILATIPDLVNKLLF